MREAVILAVIVVGMFAAMLSGAFWFAHSVCRNSAEVIGVEFEWEVVGGCFYQIDGQWIPADNYTGFEELGK